MPLSISADNLAFVLGLLAALAISGAVVYLAYRACGEPAGVVSSDPSHPPVRRRCRYCHWTTARIVDESVHVELGDVVEVRCFACDRCGLPHWVVNRTHVPRRAIR
jgi:hypothetical protein